MTEDLSNTEGVAQSENSFENSIKEFSAWLDQKIEEADPLPTAEEAELGELCRVPSGQFDQCKLVDDQTAPLLGFLEEERDSEAATEGGILAEIEAEFDNLTEGEN